MSKKVLFLADLHLSSVSPGSRTDNYAEAAFAKLAQVSDLIRRLDVDVLVVLGDIFHLKSWTKNPYWLTNRFVNWLKEVDANGCKIVVVVGNHDVPYGNVDFVESQPIGTILAQSFVRRDLILADPSMRIVAHDFDPAFTKQDLHRYQRGDEKYLIVCAHQNFMEKGQLPNEPTINFNEIDAQIDVLAFGHIHTPTVITKVNGIWFVNPGALMRGTLHKDNLDREVCVVLFKFDEAIQYKKFALDVAPSAQVFDLEKKERRDAHDTQIESFVEMLDDSAHVTSSSDPVVVLDGLDVPDAVRELARTYLDGGSIDI